jgi:effector-binding domain-containing protein
MTYVVELKDIPGQLALTVRKRATTATIGQAMGEAFGAIMAHVEAGHAHYAGPPFALYPGELADEFDLVVCMPVMPGATAGPGIDLEEVPGGLAACTMHKGPYSAVCEAYDALQLWMAANGKQPGALAREVYLNEPGAVPEAELLTEVDWPIG